jgi:hypothetical protein
MVENPGAIWIPFSRNPNGTVKHICLGRAQELLDCGRLMQMPYWKVFRHGGALIGFLNEDRDVQRILDWMSSASVFI